MIKYELFLKEISNFLRSCTIKNKYFAQRIADQVIAKYGFSTLPDKFNPYYLRMCGLSTLDLKIPRYLIDENGEKQYNEDYTYAQMTDPNPELTRLIMVRLDVIQNETEKHIPSSQKIDAGIDIIKNQIAQEFITAAGIRDIDGKKYTGRSKVFALKSIAYGESGNKVSKIKDLHNKIADLNSNDNGLAINIITGEINWDDFHENSIVFKNGTDKTFEIESRSDLTEELASENVEKLYLNVNSEKKTYIRSGSVWEELNIATMMAIEISECFNANEDIKNFSFSIDEFNRSVDINFILTPSQPSIEALVVIGALELDWLDMYNGYDKNDVLSQYKILTDISNTVYNGSYSGDIVDVSYSRINEALGYGASEYPTAGSKINYRRYARAWKSTAGSLVYTEKESPKQNDIIYSSDNLEKKTKWKVTETIINATGKWIHVSTDANTEMEFVRSETDDVILTYGTYVFNGLEWKAMDVRDLFDEEWKRRFTEEFADYTDFTYTTMATPFDSESFNEKLVVGKNNDLYIDRYEYVGWDRPVYVPTHDYINELTKDFTLYTRLFNRMKDAHVKTALKYYIGSDSYNNACENYIGSIDFIKGVCYPVHTLLEQLNTTTSTDKNGTQILTASEEEYRKYIKRIEDATSDIANKKNFTLLRYDSTLLKENEADSMVNALNQTLTCIRERWDIGEFGYEELYYSAVWAAIWTHLPYILLVQRILNLRTEAVHVDHIWEYLESKGLKDYRTVMDIDQQVFLYKNMEYIRGNESKQRTLRILVDKLLSKFGATVNTKSVLLDTSLAKENDKPNLHGGTHNINGLTESVSASVKILSEDLDEQTNVISDTQGRIEDFDKTYQREYVSGLEPYYGNTQAEQMQRVADAHDEIEVKRHTYAPTKLAEITQKGLPSDVTRLAMAFIFQTLMRKISGNEILPSCVVNVMFTGLSTPKTFTVAECIALIFYALRKSEWYTYKNKYNEQNRSTEIWKSLSDSEGNGLSLNEHKSLIERIITYETCPKSTNPAYESDCNHFYYNPNEVFNDFIPKRANIWLPYIGPYSVYTFNENGSYAKDNDGNLIIEKVDVTLPMSDVLISSYIGNPNIKISEKTMVTNSSEKQLLQIVSPVEYNSLELQSWNDMVSAENNTQNDSRTYDHWEYKWDAAAGRFKIVVTVDKRMPDSVIDKIDICTGEQKFESLKFISVSSTLVGGVISGSSRLESDNWFIPRLHDIELTVRNHTELINNLVYQANFMINHFQMTRNSIDAYFHKAMSYIYEKITVKADVALDLVPGHTTYTDWFETDTELKSVFRFIEEGTDQSVVYNSIADSFIEALFPADKLTLTGSVNQTKYAAMKELFQWLGSYNLAYLNTSSVQYETLFLHPITINTTLQKGSNERAWAINNNFVFDDGEFACSVYSGLTHARHYGIRTSNLRNFSVNTDPTKSINHSEWCAINTGWGMTTIGEDHVYKYMNYVKNVTPYDYNWNTADKDSLINEIKSACLLYGYKTVATYDTNESKWIDNRGNVYNPSNKSIVMNKHNSDIELYNQYNDFDNCVIILTNDRQVFEWDTIPSEHFKIARTMKSNSTMLINFVHNWTSNSNPEPDGDGWMAGNVDFTLGSKTYIGSAVYTEVTDPGSQTVCQNTFFQESVNLKPFVIKFNN